MHLGDWTHGEFELIIADGGSTDATLDIARKQSARIVSGSRGRGPQLAAGGAEASGDWLLFLHADTHLEAGWQSIVRQFIGGNSGKAGVFRFRLDDQSSKARLLEWIVALRTRIFALPYGDQGLLISRRLYDEIGGFRPIPIMEDVDIVRRIGRRRLRCLECDAVTSAARYHHDGYLPRILRNVVCISLWFAGVSPQRIARIYQ